MGATLSSKLEKSTAKVVSDFSGEYFWKLISILPPILDVPPPKAQKAFANLSVKRHLQVMKRRLPNIFLKSEDNSLKNSLE